jgi:hypothetical protein
MTTVTFKGLRFNNVSQHRDALDTLGNLYVIQCKTCASATVARRLEAVTLRLWVNVDLEKRTGTCPVCAHDQGIARKDVAPYREPKAEKRTQPKPHAKRDHPELMAAFHKATADRQYARLAQGLEAIKDYQRKHAHAPTGAILGTMIGCGAESAKAVMRELEKRGLLVYGGNSQNVQRRYRSLVSLDVTL